MSDILTTSELDATTNPVILPGGFSYDEESGVCYRLLDFMGFPGYRVGDDGSVQTCMVRGGGSGKGCFTRSENWRNMKFQAGHRGHLRVCLSKFGQNNPDRKQFKHSIHVLVATVFIGSRPEDCTECHHFPDPDTKNNRVENLRWGTEQDNADHRRIHGNTASGETIDNSKLTTEQVLEIRSLYATGNWRQVDLAAKFNVVQTAISCIVRRHTWKHI